MLPPPNQGSASAGLSRKPSPTARNRCNTKAYMYLHHSPSENNVPMSTLCQCTNQLTHHQTNKLAWHMEHTSGSRPSNQDAHSFSCRNHLRGPKPITWPSLFTPSHLCPIRSLCFSKAVSTRSGDANCINASPVVRPCASCSNVIPLGIISNPINPRQPKHLRV